MNRISLAALAAVSLFALAGVASAQPSDAPSQTSVATTAFTDTQLTAFAAASLEVDPISRSLVSATPEAQQQAAAQIREILTRHQLDAATYNAIAAAAQADPELAQQIATLQTNADASAGQP